MYQWWLEIVENEKLSSKLKIIIDFLILLFVIMILRDHVQLLG